MGLVQELGEHQHHPFRYYKMLYVIFDKTWRCGFGMHQKCDVIPLTGGGGEGGVAKEVSEDMHIPSCP